MFTTATIEPTSIAAARRASDVEVSLLFDPAAPLAVIDLVVDSPGPARDDAAYLALIDAALERLHVYRTDYAALVEGALS